MTTDSKGKQMMTQFDEQCLELAQHFYPDAPRTPYGLDYLAGLIQQAVEDSGCAHNPDKYCTCWVQFSNGVECPHNSKVSDEV